jgi:CPA2 family monovalent cation:H+ antiporter-2
MVLTPFILKYIDKIVKLFIKSKFSEFTNIKEIQDHIVLIWYWRVGNMVSDFLTEHNYEHIIIENDLDAFSLAKYDWKRVFLGDAYDDNMLDNVSITKAASVIVSIWSSYDIIPIVHKLSKIIDPDKIIVKVSKFNEKELIAKLDISHIIVETERTAKTIIDYLK